MKLYKNGKIILADKILDNHILIADHKIRKICTDRDYHPTEEDVIIDLEGNYLSPGFIDVHIHGANGFDTMDGTRESLNEISTILPASGVTSYLATTMTMPKTQIHQSLDCAKDIIMNNTHRGAELLGIHAEGPFISLTYKGAQNPQYIEPPTYEFYAPYYDIIKLITLAPEEDSSFNFTKITKAKHKDIVLSIGHSNADYDTSLSAFHHGFTHVTHLFNAMTGLHHREPGVVGAALTEDFYTEIIADTVHVRPELYKLLLKAKGKDHIILVTDAMCAACLSPGDYELGGQKVIVDASSARLSSGVLAGSILRMNKGIKNFLDYTDLTLYEAINLATKNPAQELGLYNRIGSIDIDKDADLLVIDEHLEIQATYCKGKLSYSKEDTNAS